MIALVLKISRFVWEKMGKIATAMEDAFAANANASGSFDLYFPLWKILLLIF